MAGLWLGLTLRIFSRALAFSVGAGILFFQPAGQCLEETAAVGSLTRLHAAQWLAHEGYHVFPTRWLRRKIRGVRVGRILEENAPFKLSMASTVLLAAFGEFQPDE
ncbi:hypothetical protein KEM52_000774 [Ascosphaera acerosa]|nr:hypothetical protein KEM52_000774 [Ascosphaera acerosa]